MAQGKSYSFAVGSKHGPRSAKWIVTINGRDVYVNTAAMAIAWHASLHESGKWHIRANNPGAGGGSGFLVESHSGNYPHDKYAVGLYIAVPDSCLRPASDVRKASDPDKWLDRPPYGGSVEISVMTWDWRKNVHGEEWPGKAAGTHPLKFYKFDDYTCVFILLRILTADHPSSLLVERDKPKIEPIVLNSPERRVYMFTTTPEGSLVIVEYAID